MKNYMAVLAAEWSNTCQKSDKKELVEEILVSQIEYGLEITTGDLEKKSDYNAENAEQGNRIGSKQRKQYRDTKGFGMATIKGGALKEN